MSKGLLLEMAGSDPANETRFLECMACPGFLEGRRYAAVQGAPEWLALYDLETPEALAGDRYQRIAARADAAPFVRNVYAEIRQPVTSGPRATGAGLLLVAIDIDPAHEADLHRWYDDEHVAERIAIPGFLRARRFQVVQGRPRYLALYDLETPDVLDSAAYRRAAGPAATPMTRRMSEKFNPMIRNVYREIRAQDPG